MNSQARTSQHQKTDAMSDYPLGITRVGKKEFRWGDRTYVMGIVNVTPDSFSGDGLGGDIEAAVAQARRFEEEGSDIIDIGGESTRPTASPVSADEELKRVIPALEKIARAVKIPISVDTYKWEVASRALQAGASIINDVWGLKKDHRLAKLAAKKKVPLILMHNQNGTTYADLVPEVVDSLRNSIKLALDAGVPRENIIVDPGIGFGKTVEHNLEIMRRLDEFKALQRPVLLGTSRKSMIGLVLDLPASDRLEGTAATVAIGITKGADIVRVHDVRQMLRVCRMSDAIIRGKRAWSRST